MPRRSSRSRSSRFGSKASVAPKKKSPASAGLVTMEETSQAHAASRPNRGATTDRAHTNSRSLQICNRVVFAYRIRQTRQLRPPDSRQARPKKTQPPADNRGSRTALERLGGLNGLDGPTRQLTTDRQDTADRDRIVATQSAVSRQILLSLPRRHCMAEDAVQ